MSRHRFHGDTRRFETLSDLVFKEFGRSVTYIADVAGGQGMLSRILNKKYNYTSEVIDPRGYTLKGISNRPTYYHHNLATYYDLIVGLHLDEAMREVALSALQVPTIIVPCCNFWSDEKLWSYELVDEILKYLHRNHVKTKKVELPLKKPKNIAIITHPTPASKTSPGSFDEPILKKLAHQSELTP